METAADRAAFEALASYYGHIADGDLLFHLMALEQDLETDQRDSKPYGSADGGGDSPDPKNKKTKIRDWLEQITTTHPLDRKRIDAVQQLAVDNGWSTIGDLTPLPPDYQKWLVRSRSKSQQQR